MKSHADDETCSPHLVLCLRSCAIIHAFRWTECVDLVAGFDRMVHEEPVLLPSLFDKRPSAA